MAVNGKRKGNSGERELASILSKHLGGFFQRVQSSGSFIGKSNNIRKETMSATQIRAAKADIIPPDEFPKLVVECKAYRDFQYHAFATSQDIQKLDNWIKELEFDCDENDVGILCFKINRKGWSICVSIKYLQEFQLDNYIVYKKYIITGLEDFLTKNSEKFKSLIA